MVKINAKFTCPQCSMISISPQTINPDFVYFQTHTRDVLPIPKKVRDDNDVEHNTTAAEKQAHRDLFVTQITEVKNRMGRDFPNNRFSIKARDITNRETDELEKVEVVIMIEPVVAAVAFQSETDLMDSKYIILKCPQCETILYSVQP